MKIHYLKGDATKPIDSSFCKFIAHNCNNQGAWGAGFVMAISHRWPEPELMYRKASYDGKMRLGEIQTVWVDQELAVVNMVAQDGFPSRDRPRAVDYKALEKCLIKLNEKAIEHGASIHMPRIGCGLGGGDWVDIEPLIQLHIEVPVYVYDFS